MNMRDRPAVAELKVAAFVREAGPNLIDMQLRDIARACDVSDATVVRYCRREGFRGLKDFKIALSRRTERPKNPPLTGGEPMAEIRQRLVEGSVQALYDTGERLNPAALERAAEAIFKSGTLDIYAVGGSVPIASHLRLQMIKLGFHADIYPDISSMRLSYAVLSPQAAVMSISVSGETQDVLAAQRAARSAGCVTICITAHPESSLAKASDIVLEAAAGGCFLRDSSYGHISQLAVADMLFAVLYSMKQQS